MDGASAKRESEERQKRRVRRRVRRRRKRGRRRRRRRRRERGRRDEGGALNEGAADDEGGRSRGGPTQRAPQGQGSHLAAPPPRPGLRVPLPPRGARAPCGRMGSLTGDAFRRTSSRPPAAGGCLRRMGSLTGDALGAPEVDPLLPRALSRPGVAPCAGWGLSLGRPSPRGTPRGASGRSE